MSAASSRLASQFGAVIRKRREAKQWTQQVFADRIGMHRAQYAAFERGEASDVQLSTLERIATGLGVPVWVLIRAVEIPAAERS